MYPEANSLSLVDLTYLARSLGKITMSLTGTRHYNHRIFQLSQKVKGEGQSMSS